MSEISTVDRESIIEHVLAELSSGRAVSRILREDEGMPAARTFWNWHYSDQTLMQKVAHAREAGVEALMDQTVDIADTHEKGVVRTIKPDGTIEEREEDMLGHRKLRIDARHKYAQMIAPRKYGAKLDITSGGERVTADDTAIAVRAAALVQAALARDESE